MKRIILMTALLLAGTLAGCGGYSGGYASFSVYSPRVVHARPYYYGPAYGNYWVPGHWAYGPGGRIWVGGYWR